MKNEVHLSKSKYCAGVTCPKILWLDKNMPEQKSAQDETRMEIGMQVGELAKGYFGDYTDVPFDADNFDSMIESTKRLINQGAEVITEAAFEFDGNFCRVDILRKVESGYEIVEVKSSSTEDGKDNSRKYLDDLSYQYYVVKNSGLNISKISLMQINKKYVRHGKLDIKQLFMFTDCTVDVLQMQSEIPANIANIKAIATSEKEPNINIGSRCKDCAYENWCFRNLPENSVYDIGFGMRGTKKDGFYNTGIIAFEDILKNDLKLSPKQLLQVESAVNTGTPHIEADNIRRFLAELTYPLYHLDFETMQQAIPLWDGINPYRQIPFQYSLHIQQKALENPAHKEFLGETGEDPRCNIAERLCKDIPENVTVLAYYAPFEKGRLSELAEDFPDLASHLLNIRDNIKDLAVPFKNGYYYCREMGGSYSIKFVLPALCGGDPELDYHNLDLIHNGTEAMAVFADLAYKTPEEIAKIRTALLAYCKLDTLAMVKILEKLYEAV